MKCERDADRVRLLGGLHVLGTERHEARRIDNQLRGRAGRQGDPGSSRFFVSLEDELMRRFGGASIAGLMDKLGLEEDVPLEHPWVSARDRERAAKSRSVQLRYPQARGRIRRRVEPPARRHLWRPRSGPVRRQPQAADHGVGRGDAGRADRRRARRRPARAGTGNAAPAGRAHLPDAGELLVGRSRAADRPRGSRRPPDGAGRSGLRPQGAGARARADAPARAHLDAQRDRSAVDRAPDGDRRPARGHRPARVRPARSADRVQGRSGAHVRRAAVERSRRRRQRDLPPADAAASAAAAAADRGGLRRPQRSAGERSQRHERHATAPPTARNGAPARRVAAAAAAARPRG